jgi:hypothetical protein
MLLDLVGTGGPVGRQREEVARKVYSRPSAAK